MERSPIKSGGRAGGAVTGGLSWNALRADSETCSQPYPGKVDVHFLAGGYGSGLGPSDPMRNYIHNAFPKINGKRPIFQSLMPKSKIAMQTAMTQVQVCMQENIRAQRSDVRGQMPMGSQVLRAGAQQAEQQMKRRAQQRNPTSLNFGSAGMRVADLTEYYEAQSMDICGYGPQVMEILTAPMSEPVQGVSPATNQTVTFQTASPVPAPQAPRALGSELVLD